MMRLFLSALVVLVAISIIPTVFSDSLRGELTIPDWIKNTAGWWADGQIDDAAFLQVLEFLINEEIIIVQIPVVESDAEVVPGWVKNTAGWWAEDKIHDFTFVGAIEYLIAHGIITIGQEHEEELPPCPDKIISGYACTVEEAVVVLSDFYMEVNGHSCNYCVGWAYVGEDYKFQIETFDKKQGSHIDVITTTVKIISKDGELRYDFGEVTTEDGVYRGSVLIPNMDWYAGNILSVTGEYNGVETTIEKEFEVFRKSSTIVRCSNTNPFDTSDKDADMTGITFNSDGTKMFLVGLENDKVYEYDLCHPYSMGGAKHTKSFSVGNQDNAPQGMAFNSDGTKMFIVGQGGDDVTEYALLRAFDISTASHSGQGCDGGELPSALDFNSDGTKLRILDKSSNKVREYVLSTGFVVTSGCTYSSDADSAALNSLSGVSEAKAQGMAFNSDGTKMFILGEQRDKVFAFTLLPAYDVSEETLVYALDISDQELTPSGIEFSSNGKQMFIVGRNGDEINAYGLATAWDISTANPR